MDLFDLSPDLAYLAYAYVPEAGTHLTPPQQVELLRRAYGVRISPDRAGLALRALGGELIDQVRVVELWEILEIDDDEWRQLLHQAGTNDSYDELLRLDVSLSYTWIFLSALEQNNLDLARRVEAEAELSSDEIYGLLDSPHLDVVRYVFELYGDEYFNPEVLADQAERAGNLRFAMRLRELLD